MTPNELLYLSPFLHFLHFFVLELQSLRYGEALLPLQQLLFLSGLNLYMAGQRFLVKILPPILLLDRFEALFS